MQKRLRRKQWLFLNRKAPTKNKKLNGSELHTLLFLYGIERKNHHGKTVGETRAKYKKLKEDNTPSKKYKNWTESNKAKLTRLMKENVQITELARQREADEQVDTWRLIAMVKVRDADKLIQIIRTHFPSTQSSASTKSSALTKSASLLTQSRGSLDPLETCFPSQFKQ